MNVEELAAELERLRQEHAASMERNRSLEQELAAANKTIKRAKDPNPVERPSVKRVLKLVTDACMNLQRVIGGWVLSLGYKTRRFKKLSDIWELLLADDWYLGDIFPEEHKTCYSTPGSAPRVEDSLMPQREPVVKKVVRHGLPPGISMEHLAAEWRMFPSARPAIQELLRRMKLSPDLFGT